MPNKFHTLVLQKHILAPRQGTLSYTLADATKKHETEQRTLAGTFGMKHFKEVSMNHNPAVFLPQIQLDVLGNLFNSPTPYGRLVSE